MNGNSAGKGQRRATDFDLAKCTGGNCDRRVAYLHAASKLLVSDLEEMVEQWREDGKAVKYLEANQARALGAMIMGMGSLSYGELAGERMQLGLFLNDPEEEHDCFSDNTHNSLLQSNRNFKCVPRKYRRINGDVVGGTSLAEYVRMLEPQLSGEVEAKIGGATVALSAMRSRRNPVKPMTRC